MNVIVADNEKRYTHRDLVMWARNGLIYAEDQKDGECVVYTQDEFRQMMVQIGKSYERQIDKWAISDKYFVDLRREYRNLLLASEELLATAKAQGDPTAGVVTLEKQRADMRSQLMDYNREPGEARVHDDRRDAPAFNPGNDPRVVRSPHGGIYLPHGGGAKTVRKHFGA